MLSNTRKDRFNRDQPTWISIVPLCSTRAHSGWSLSMMMSVVHVDEMEWCGVTLSLVKMLRYPSIPHPLFFIGLSLIFASLFHQNALISSDRRIITTPLLTHNSYSSSSYYPSSSHLSSLSSLQTLADLVWLNRLDPFDVHLV